jgi:diguanylate cyclase (GGDEF)-like protein
MAGRRPGQDDPPRLVLRFAIVTVIGLALAAAAILLVVRHYNTVQAERGAAAQARVIAATILRGELFATDFHRRVPESRSSALDQLFERRVFGEGVLLVTLYSDEGNATYSTDHRLVGTRIDDLEHIRETLAGLVRSDVTTVLGRKALRTYAPVAVPGGRGAVSIFQDYGPISQAASATFLPVVGIFEAVLILLCIVLVPILRRVSVRLRRQMEEIEHRALYDELTELPNRSLFRDRTEQAILAARREGHQAAVMMLDVDRFKEINDALGHESGDTLLRELGSRLRDEVRANETFARLGGDEFAILLPNGPADAADRVAARVHSALEKPFDLRGLSLEVSTSVGIALYPEHGEDVDTLIQHADVAMYLAKDAHAGTAYYDADQDESDAARLALAGELRRAIEDDELLLHFQPKASLQTEEIVGVEALVRWEHPERGFIPPGEFVPLAERMGLIKPLSRFVLEAAIEQCELWNSEGRDLRVSVNLTVPDLLDLELPDRIAARLSQTSIRPDQLELELTESTILADPFRVRQVLNRLNEMGLRLAIDDFGTGYSSFAYLKRLPVQTIKIDRSFVMGMCEDASDATIVRSTIDLGRNLGLEIVAEGVESEEIWEALREEGCTLAQGYLIGKPMPAAELALLLDGRGVEAEAPSAWARLTQLG